jgi:preprotein translocase subunit SecE
MDKTNQKILTLSFVTFAILISISLSLLLKTFAGTFGFFARLHDVYFIKHGLPVMAGIALFVSLQFNKKVLAWGEDVALEIRRVVWPSRKDTTAMTIVVVVMVLISAVIITTFDFVSGYLVNYLVR